LITALNFNYPISFIEIHDQDQRIFIGTSTDGAVFVINGKAFNQITSFTLPETSSRVHDEFIIAF